MKKRRIVHRLVLELTSRSSLANRFYRVYKKKQSDKKNDIYKGVGRRETFTSIYLKNKWGGVKGEFYSGEGSYMEVYVSTYCETIKKFVKENDIVEVCDLGCGDFHVASLWLEENIKYTGIDIVREMIEAHKVKYDMSNVNFMCLDIVEDELPDAQLCIIRQVLQHLDNDEISQILAKTKKYPYVIITEHVVAKEYAVKYNVDKNHGEHIRIYSDSGVYLDEEPFNQSVEVLLKVPYQSNVAKFSRSKEELVTVLIRN